MLVPYARKNHNVSNFNPFHDFDELERAFFSDNALGEFKADIQEDGDNFVLEADLPGFKKEDIHVDVADDRLTVSAERHSNFEDKDKKGNYLRCERSYGSYARSFDISGIHAAGIIFRNTHDLFIVRKCQSQQIHRIQRRPVADCQAGAYMAVKGCGLFPELFF